MTAHSQIVFGEDDNPSFTLTGELTSMFTAGFQDDLQIIKPGNDIEPGVYYGNDERDGSIISGKNGYFISFNFSFLFKPVSNVDLYAKFLTRYRPGSPYIPMQLENADVEEFTFKVDAVYARVNAVKGLGFDIPLDIWLKGGKFDATPSHFHKVSQYGAESVMNTLRTKSTYSLQLEADYPISGDSFLNFSFTSNLKLNEEIPELLDDDAIERDQVFLHGISTGDSVIPIHAALRLVNFSFSSFTLSTELIYAINAMHIYSGHNFGLGLGVNMPIMENFSVPLGLAMAYHEKNIDALAGAAVADSYISDFYISNGYSNNDTNTTSFRQTMRIGAATGIRYKPIDSLSANFNIGFAFSQIAHIYRDPLDITALSIDLRIVYMERFLLGGGIFLGTLADVEWKRKDTVSYAGSPSDAFSGHVFTLEENMGYEIFCGIQFNKSKFIVGYNINKGLSMYNSIEAPPDTQMKYKQKDAQSADGLFERGGLFANLVISW
jgi:hypothetical protein